MSLKDFLKPHDGEKLRIDDIEALENNMILSFLKLCDSFIWHKTEDFSKNAATALLICR